MKYTIDLPNELEEKLNEYLREHPGETVSSVVRGVLEDKLGADKPKDLSPLLELAGFVKELKQSSTPTDEDWDAFMSLAGIVEVEVYDPERPEDDVVWQVRDARDA